MKQYDLIVIGSGPGGMEAADIAIRQGLSVALVEKGLMGGTCLNRGCIPTKCLCAAAGRVLELVSDPQFGIDIDTHHISYQRAHQRAVEVVGGIRADVERAYADIDVFCGEARLGEERTVVVGSHFLKAHRIVIATGSRPAPLAIDGSECMVDSDAFLALDVLPETMVIVGGGVIGLEIASIAAAYGVEVTVLEYCLEILPGFDPEVAKRLRSYLSRRGINIVTGAKVSSVAKHGDSYSVTFEVKGKTKFAEAALVIGAVGRRPVLPDGLADAGVTLTDRGFIAVDSHYATRADGIYAVGDVNGICMLAHAASAQARVAMGVAKDTGVIPGVVFTSPACATVGARVSDSDAFKAAKVPMGANAMALAEGETDGILKLVYDGDTDVIVGAQAVGHHAAELIASAAILIDHKVTRKSFATEAVCAHPGIAELLQTAASLQS